MYIGSTRCVNIQNRAHPNFPWPRRNGMVNPLKSRRFFLVATIKKRLLPSGLIRWQVNFTDANTVRRAKLFERKKDADAYLVVARAQVRAGTFVSDSDALSVGAAADAWLDQCRLRRDTGRRMERATCRDYDDGSTLKRVGRRAPRRTS